MGSSLSTLQEVSRRFDAEDLTFLAHHPYMHYTVQLFDVRCNNEMLGCLKSNL